MNNLTAEKLLTAQNALRDIERILQALTPWTYQAEMALWHEIGRAQGTARFGLGMGGATIPVTASAKVGDAYPELL